MSGSNAPPAPAVYANGVGSVTDANLNSFVQGAMLASDLRAFVGLTDMTVMLVGITTPDDGGQGIFYWSPNSTAPDDNNNVIAPNGQTMGRWLRLIGPQSTNNGGYYAIDTGTVNNIVITLSPSAPSLASLTGVPVRILVKLENTGAVTITITGLANNVPTSLPGGEHLVFASLQTLGIATFIYDGSKFELQTVALGLPALIIQDYLDLPAAAADITVSSPIGQGAPIEIATATNITVPATVTNSTTIVETGLTVQFTSDTGKGSDVPTSSDRVGIYAAIQADTNSGNVWAINPLVLVNSGACANGGVQVAEFDLDNNSGSDYGDTALEPGLSQPAAYGMQITGSGSNKVTAAIIVNGTLGGGGNYWNRGIAFTASIDQSEIEGYANCTAGYVVAGAKQVGITTAGGTFSTAPILIGNATYLNSTNAADSGVYPLIGANASDAIIIGGSSVTNIKTTTSGNFVPSADNAQSCGASGARWTEVWAANGTIQTSDPALKTDIQPLPSCLPLLHAISPIRFKWKQEGVENVTTTEEQDVWVHETHPIHESQVALVDGRHVLVPSTKTVSVGIMDEVPVWNLDGTPNLTTIPAQAERRDKDGKIVSPAKPAQVFQTTHRVPRKERQSVPVTKQVPKAGSTVHWGFSATDIKTAMDRAGLDFGGYIKEDAAGPESLRPDQMTPVLWKAGQEMAAQLEMQTTQIEALKSQIDALKSQIDALTAQLASQKPTVP